MAELLSPAERLVLEPLGPIGHLVDNSYSDFQLVQLPASKVDGQGSLAAPPRKLRKHTALCKKVTKMILLLETLN